MRIFTFLIAIYANTAFAEDFPRDEGGIAYLPPPPVIVTQAAKVTPSVNPGDHGAVNAGQATEQSNLEKRCTPNRTGGMNCLPSALSDAR